MRRRERPQVEVLARLDGLSKLPKSELEALAGRLSLSHALPGERVLEIGNADRSSTYLLEGSVRLTAADGASRNIAANDAAASAPLSRLRPSLYNIQATTPIRYVRVPDDVLAIFAQAEEWKPDTDSEPYPADTGYVVDASADNDLMATILDDFDAGRVLLPSLPDVIEKVGQAVINAGDNTSSIVRALRMDPALTAKTLKAACQRAPYRGRATVSITESVTTLGADRVIELTVHCALREKLRSRSPVISRQMQEWWVRSLRVAAFCETLARKAGGLDPELAAIAGTLHSIGEPVILQYALAFEHLCEKPAIDLAVRTHTGEVTQILLAMWNLPRDIVVAATSSPASLSVGADLQLGYRDVVALARIHANPENFSPEVSSTAKIIERSLGLEVSNDVVETPQEIRAIIAA